MLNMTPEDFFTLTEMREGLTAPARVKELINVLQKDKHNSVKNVVDLARQWSAVASAITATENKDCLDLFLQLDGLCYFDTWLKHGKECLQEKVDSFVEEAMIALLGAIEKLHKDEKKSVISGIMMTVKDLLSNKSSRVQDRARSLFDIWNQNSESTAVHMDVDKDEAVCDNLVGVNENPVCKHDQPERSLQDISTSMGINNEEKNLKPVLGEMMPAISPEIMQTEVVAYLAIPTSDKTFGHESIHDGSANTVHCDALKLVSETSPVLENPTAHQLEATTGIKSPGSAVPGQRKLEGQSDVASSNEHDEANQMLPIRSCNNLGVTDTSFCVDSTNTVESKVADNNEKDVDVEKEDPCLYKKSSDDVRKEVSEGKDEMFDSISPNPCARISAFDSTASAGVLQGSSVNEHSVGKEDLTTILSKEEDREAIKESNGQNVSDKDEVDSGNEDLSKNISRKEDGEVPDNGQNVSDEDEVDCQNEVINTNLSRKEDTDALEKSDGQNVSDENGNLTMNLSRKEDTDALEKSDGNVSDENGNLTMNLSRKEDTEEAIEGSNSQNVPDENGDLPMNLSKEDDTEMIEGSNGQNVSDEDEDVRENDHDFSMSGADNKHSVAHKSGFQLDYDMFDPLEVARQVAIEVEREVDCREPSCSSSERMSDDGKLESSDYLKEKSSRVIHCPIKDVPTGPNLYAVVGDKAFVKAKNLPNQRENCIVDIEPTGASEVTRKKVHDVVSNVCGFDLNEDVFSDIDSDNQIDPVTAPISVVSASRAATSGLPPSPLQFEGALGWKGYFEASAFRPASMCKISEGANSIFASGSSSSLFRRKEYLDFDLNVAEGEDKITDFPPTKEIPNSTGRSSENCSIEASPKKSDLLQLDLNCVSDSGDAPLSYWRKEERVLPHNNGQLSPSASSSSSSMQPSLKNIDLNDQPSFTEFLHPALTAKPSPNLYTSGSGGSKTDESVISLMGARVEVRRKDNVPQTVPLLSGRIVDPAPDASMTRNDSVMGLASSSLYAHPYMYGYSGPSSGPTVPYSSPIYGLGGQIPYMVDSRGTPVVPQVLGPVPALRPSFPQHPSFFENLAAAPADSNGFVPPGHGFDLNTRVMTEGRSRDAGNMLQLFNPGQGISMDEQIRAYSQSTSSSGVGGKRKEPDGGWDPSPFNYKHHQPPWK